MWDNADLLFYLRASTFVCVLFLLAGCAFAASVTPSPTTPPRTPMMLPPATTTPTRKPPAPPPAWWDSQVVMPPDAEFTGDAKHATWTMRATNADGLRDILLRQASAAGYQTFVVTQSPSAIYDVLMVKGQTAFAVNLTLGIDAITITALQVGVMHVKISGVVNLETDLPLRTHLDTTPGSEASFGTALPSPQCATCQYFINVHIAPFKGPGVYDSKPGTSIIDIEVIPGGDPMQDDYRWAQVCLVAVNPINASFTCGSLQNVNDQTKRIDISGSWVQP